MLDNYGSSEAVPTFACPWSGFGGAHRRPRTEADITEEDDRIEQLGAEPVCSLIVFPIY